MIRVKTSHPVATWEPYAQQRREAVIVCVTSQHTGRALIERGAQIAQSEGLDLQVLSVAPRGPLKLQDTLALEELFHHAMQLGATMSIYYSSHTWDTAHAFLKRHRVRHFVVGVPKPQGRFVQQLRQHFAHVPLHIVEASTPILPVSAAQ